MHTPSSPPLATVRAEIRAWLVLAALGLRLRHAAVVDRLGGPAAALSLSPGEVAGTFDVRGFASAPPDDRAREKAEIDADAALRWLEDGGGRVLLPRELACLLDAPSSPLVLFARGPAELLSRRPSLAVVGSRAATPRGLERARAVGEAAASAGVLVVSGGALGVDLAAHEGALAAGGGTVVVLGDPIRAGSDERPKRIRDLDGGAASERLLVVSPHGPWAPRDKRLWASRNALIAALSDAVVVIEGRARSGTVYTADAARRLERPILAVPGDPDDEVAAAPNELLRKGVARPLLRVHDAIEAVHPGGHVAAVEAEQLELPALSDEEAAVLRALGPRGAEVDVDTLAAKVDVPASALWSCVLGLELRGIVERSGSWYRRVR